jgi:hypothetical protein
LYASCIEVFKYRIVELTEDAIERWEQDRTLSSFILSRSIFESVLVVEWVNYYIQDFLDGKLSQEEIHKKLLLATHASRLEDSPLPATNIMSIIQMLDKCLSKQAGERWQQTSVYMDGTQRLHTRIQKVLSCSMQSSIKNHYL